MDPVIGKTEEHLELLSSEDFVRELAEARENAQRDWVSSMSGSREEGIAIGKAEGKAEGRAEGKAEMATKLLAKGMDIAWIAEVSGMTEQQIRRLAISAPEDIKARK